jgi:hypothetical protein
MASVLPPVLSIDIQTLWSHTSWSLGGAAGGRSLSVHVCPPSSDAESRAVWPPPSPGAVLTAYSSPPALDASIA